MKIAFIVEKFPTLTETFILSQITGLLDLGHDVRIIAQYDPMEARIHQDVHKYALLSRTHYCMPHSRYRRIGTAIRRIVTNFHKAPLKVLKSLNVIRYGRSALSLTLFHTLLPFLDQSFDVIHAHFGPNGITAVNLKSLGIAGKVLTTFHGDDVSRYIKRHGKSVYDRLFAYGDLFLPVSEYWKNRLISLGCDSKKIIVHRMGIDTKKFHFSERRVCEGDPVRILSVGRFVEKKGYEYALKAVARTIEKHKNIEYIIVGDGPLRNEILSLAEELGIRDQVLHIEAADQETLLSIYQKAHFFLLPSVTAHNGDQEGIPLVLMEAQAMGLPVIATHHSGIPEVVVDGKSGFLLDERDESAMAKKIEYLIRHPESWSGLGRTGRKIIEQSYNIVTLNRSLERIFQNAVTTREKTPILFVTHASEIGGAERSLLDLVTRLNKKRYHPVVVVPDGNILYQYLTESKIETRVVPLLWLKKTRNLFKLCSYLRSFIVSSFKIFEIVRRENIKILHTNSISAQIYAGLVGKISGKPVIWHVRDMLDLSWHNRLLIKFCSHLAAEIVCISNAVRNHLAAVGIDLKKCRIVYNGIDLTQFRRRRNSKTFNKTNVLQVGIVGRLLPWKGHDQFLEAAKIVSDQYAALEFYIIGDTFSGEDSYKKKLETRVRDLDMEKIVNFTGFHEDVSAWYENLDIIIAPSVKPEPFGRVIIEAMAFSKPVIATNLGGPAEIVLDSETGYLIDPSSPTQIADRIIHLIRNEKLRNRFGQSGLKRVRDYFTIERCVIQIEQIYDRLSNKNG